MFIFLLLFPSLTLINECFAQKWTAKDVMAKNEKARQTLSLKAEGKIIIDGGTRKRQEKTFTWWRQIQKDQVHFNTLTLFHTPATVKGQAILFLEESGEKNEILMWLPTFKKTRIIESSQQNSSFMASDFTFSDITALQNEDYAFSEKSLESCPNVTKIKCYQIDSSLKNPQSAQRLGYHKLILWIRQDNSMTDRVHYLDESGKVFKQLDTTGPVAINPGKFFFTKLEMKNLTNAQFTILEFTDIDWKTPIPDSRFYKQKLGKDD